MAVAVQRRPVRREGAAPDSDPLRYRQSRRCPRRVRRSTTLAAGAAGRSAPSARSWSTSWACRSPAGRSARPHDVASARLLLADEFPALPRLRAVVADRAYRGLAKLAARHDLVLDIKAPPAGASGFVPIRPLVKVEHAFAQLGRWRRLSRCYEQTEASARAWLDVAAMGYLFARMRIEPA
jgi:hypothetical protein